MYRQINVCTTDRNLQQMWWRNSSDEPLRSYRLRTVTYGTACAPYLATRTLKQLALDEQNEFPVASKVLMSDFYVDDVLSGADDVPSAENLWQQLFQLLSLGGFHLGKFASNFSDTVSKNASSMTVKPKQVLGIGWHVKDDSLSVSFDSIFERIDETPIKRSVLSEITKNFDPMGFCAPIVFQAKCFMQKLWSYPGLEWDDHLSDHLKEEWLKFRTELFQVKQVSMPRCVVSKAIAASYTLHGFGDASNLGFGCCIYITTENEDGQCSSRLLCSKSRVAPLRKQTMPRLELCASVLLSQLMEKVVACMDIKFKHMYFWTDSTITLFRINSTPSKYASFVANRISLIHEKSHPNNWEYVPSELNPADIVSRGLMPSKIQNCQMWWNGPDFINDATKPWPNQPNKSTKLTDDEYRRSEIVLVQTSENQPEASFSAQIFSRYSKLSTLVKTIALCLHFMLNCRNKKLGIDLITENVRPIELENAMNKLILLVQSAAFKDELNVLKHKGNLSRKSKLTKFAPFLDGNKIIRVGGRLHHAEISYEQKHQILLPDHTLSHLILRSEHLKNLHVGPQLLLNTVRKNFWILNGRNICRKIVHQCLRCFRTRPIIQQQVMGQLPYERVNPSRPFLTVGIDFCGPFNVSYKIRSKITTKVYIAVFVCFCTKACHFELVHDLTTGAFIAAFRRFVARRGLPSVVFSDNATNFAGAQTELNELLHMFNNETQNHELIGFLSSKGILWKNIPPRSPHFGGLWEAAVKSAKHHLKRSILSETFTAEELETIIYEVEAVLNSRPLTPVSSDPNDLNALSPGHLLIGDHLTAPPDPTLLDLKFNSLSRWQRIQFIVQSFWKRWTQEYLNELQHRQKWHKPSKIVVGSMTIIKDDNIPCMKWVLGRIARTYEGVDGEVRVVDVKTKYGVFKRPVARICILPFEGNEPH